jgi:hypothetical protein
VTSRNGHTPAMRFLEIFGAFPHMIPGRPRECGSGANGTGPIPGKGAPLIGHNRASDANPCVVCS